MNVFLLSVLLVCAFTFSDVTGQLGDEIKNSTAVYKYVWKHDSNHLYNQEEQTLAIHDYQNSINGYFSGNTGDAFLISAFSSIAVYIPGESSNETWNIKHNSFKEYIEKMPSLPDLYSTGLKSGVKFDSLTITKQIKEKLYTIMSTLQQEYMLDKCDSFSVALELSKLTARPKNLDFRLLKETELDISFDLQSLVRKCNGIVQFFEPFGGFDALTEKNITLNITTMFSTGSGIEMIAYFLEITHDYYDFGRVLQTNFGSETTCLDQLTQLLGDTFIGFGGLIKVSKTVVEYIFGEISEQTLVISLEKYFTIKDNEMNKHATQWGSDVDLWLKIMRKYKLETELEVLYKALQGTHVHNWIVKGINVDKVVQTIMEEKNSNSAEKSARKVLKLLKGTQ